MLVETAFRWLSARLAGASMATRKLSSETVPDIHFLSAVSAFASVTGFRGRPLGSAPQLALFGHVAFHLISPAEGPAGETGRIWPSFAFNLQTSPAVATLKFSNARAVPWTIFLRQAGVAVRHAAEFGKFI